jgi:hypothetical protein
LEYAVEENQKVSPIGFQRSQRAQSAKQFHAKKFTTLRRQGQLFKKELFRRTELLKHFKILPRLSLGDSPIPIGEEARERTVREKTGVALSLTTTSLYTYRRLPSSTMTSRAEIAVRTLCVRHN